MSYGSISAEAHETLAIAMNRLGGQSNTGEGGEDAGRFVPDANGDLRGSRDQAGGQRRGSASPASTWSTPTTCRSRWRRAPSPARAASCRATRCTRGSPRRGYSTPGVGLISPPPHHDIYSIEDLAQLIHDLKNAQPGGPRAREAGRRGRRRHGRRRRVQGARRRGADLRARRRHRRRAADRRSSTPGAPWELGLAETQQTLLLQRAARPHRRARPTASSRPAAT